MGRSEGKGAAVRRWPGRKADLIVAHRSYVDLAARAPVYLDEVGPRRNPVMLAKAEAERFRPGGVEPGCVTHAGVLSVRAYKPAACRKGRRVTYARSP